MAQQIKFYATTSASYDALVASESVNGAGIYFVEGGELYKGTQRFGLGRVTVDANFVPSTSTKSGQARGDIVVTGTGAGWVFDGTSWISIGGDIGTITSAWKADISTWTSALAVGDANSYITSISQAADGKVTAHASPFPDIKATIGDGFASASANGITVSVTTTSGSVTQVELDAANLSVTSITASAGTFTELTVDTATFTATSVAASTLTIGGKTVEQIAQAEIAAVTANTITATGTSLPTESAVATYVSAAVSNLAGAMHFKGTATITKTGEAITVSNFSETFTPAGGDVVVDTTNNLEAVYTGSAWELLGSNSVYALDAYAPGEEDVTTGTTTLGGAVHAIASAFDNLGTAASKNYADSLTAAGTSLPTESAVAAYVSSVVEGLDANVSSSNHTGLTVSVAQADGVVTGVQAELVWLGADGNALT